VFLLVNHHCGGGVEHHVRQLRARLRLEQIRPVIVRPSRPGFLLWEERNDHERAIWCRESTHEHASINSLLELIGPAHAHVHHVIGVPLALVDLLTENGVRYDWSLHDYYTICPRVKLINADQTYCGEPDAEACNRCLEKLGDEQGHPVPISIQDWRDEFSRRLGNARRIFVPSDDVRNRLARYFPNLSVQSRPYAESPPKCPSLAAPILAGEPVRVAVVGTIVAVKGCERLLACARDARSRNLPLEFHVIGSTDRDAAFNRLNNVRISGRYQERDVYDRVGAARCHLAFLPSLWPETFMYTLSIAMFSGLYTLCFDLGAQAQRLRSWGWGQVLPLESGPDVINDTLLAAARYLATAPAAPSPPSPANYPDLLGSYYSFSADEQERLRRSQKRPGAENSQFVQRNAHAHLH